MNQRMGQSPSTGDCAVSDENLLMYLHGALPPMARFRTGRHLRRCPACRQRLATFTATSQALADTIRGETLPRWTPPTLPAPRVLSSTPFTLILLGIGLISLTASVWMTSVSAGPVPANSTAVVPPPQEAMCPLSMTIKPSSTPPPSPGANVARAATNPAEKTKGGADMESCEPKAIMSPTVH